MMNTLVLGGTGYLGQFIVAGLANTHKVDFATGQGLLQCLSSASPLMAVINCAAISQPGACEKNPALAMDVNVPSQLLEALHACKAQTGEEPLLIHISTDQVYDGSKALWHEDDACQPVNVYGRTKLKAEQAIQASWPNHVILRSSIIYGPAPMVPIGRSTFSQFVDSTLSAGTATTIFDDEFRNFVYVGDIVAVVRHLVSTPQPPPHRLFNMGGPERLSRLDFALKVAEVRGHDPQLLLPTSSASVDRGVASPADISMDVGRIQEDLGITLTPASAALRLIYNHE